MTAEGHSSHARSDIDVAALRARFDVLEEEVPVGGTSVHIARPRSADALIDDAAFAADERLPYWADIWPSGLILADHVARRQGRGKRLMELGCGVGLVSVTAARAGYGVLATDYYDDALLFTIANARANGCALETRLVDWRTLPTDLGRFDVVVGSDVLYERPYASLVAETLDRTLTAGGVAYIADPGRIATPSFLSAAGSRGMRVTQLARVPYSEGMRRQTIDLYELSRT